VAGYRPGVSSVDRHISMTGRRDLHDRLTIQGDRLSTDRQKLARDPD